MNIFKYACRIKLKSYSFIILILLPVYYYSLLEQIINWKVL